MQPRWTPLGVAFLFVLAGCTRGDDGAPPGASGDGADSCDGVGETLDTDTDAHTFVALATSEGCIVAELHDDKVPITVANFVTYVDEGFYTDLLFHRIIKDFMVQTGGMKRDGSFKEPTHAPIKNEAAASGLENVEFTLSMARTTAPDSATNQFFINTDDNRASLDPQGGSAGYAVFGLVVQGRDVVEAIEDTPVTAYSQGRHCQPDNTPSCPTRDVVLHSVEVLQRPAAG